MKKSDFLFIAIIILIISTFFPFPIFENYHTHFLFNEKYWAITSYLKFAVLATMGEALGLRMKSGVYNQKGFGLLPRAIVWGFLGITLKIAFIVFDTGTPILLDRFFGMNHAVDSMVLPDIFTAINERLGFDRLITAFAIGTLLNLFYAPILMVFHKITDTHIRDNGGTLKGLFSRLKMVDNFNKIDWQVQWHFIFKKTIPLFWIPAQTINFMMPGKYRIVIAAVYSIILGALLAIASQKSNKKKPIVS